MIGEHNKMVLCAISALTDKKRRRFGKNRLNYLKILARRGIVNINLKSDDYFNCLSDYRFIISPEGNGIDCHRHYEALIAGCIPVVETNSKIYEKYLGCPILFTNDYSEITMEYLEKCYNEMLDKEWDFSRLFLNFYPENIQKEIIKNANFWSQRLSGLKWYK